MFSKITFCLALGLMIFDMLHAQDAAGGRAAALGGNSVTIIDAYAAHNNQAATGMLKNKSFGIYSDNKFLVQGISTAGFLAVLPTATGTFSADFNFFGYSKYNEIKAGIGFGKTLTSNFAIGAQVTYLAATIAEYGSANTFTVQGGVIYKPVPTIIIGAHVFNPLSAALGESDMAIPVVFKLGGSYIPSDKVLFIAELEKDILEPVRYKSGIEYKASEKLFLRSGIQFPNQLSFGAGVVAGAVNIDMAASYHQLLGFSPAFGLNYEFKKSK